MLIVMKSDVDIDYVNDDDDGEEEEEEEEEEEGANNPVGFKGVTQCFVKKKVSALSTGAIQMMIIVIMMKDHIDDDVDDNDRDDDDDDANIAPQIDHL